MAVALELVMIICKKSGVFSPIPVAADGHLGSKIARTPPYLKFITAEKGAHTSHSLLLPTPKPPLITFPATPSFHTRAIQFVCAPPQEDVIISPCDHMIPAIMY